MLSSSFFTAINPCWPTHATKHLAMMNPKSQQPLPYAGTACDTMRLSCMGAKASKLCAERCCPPQLPPPCQVDWQLKLHASSNTRAAKAPHKHQKLWQTSLSQFFYVVDGWLQPQTIARHCAHRRLPGWPEPWLSLTPLRRASRTPVTVVGPRVSTFNAHAVSGACTQPEKNNLL
jgi:hypothetical protein